MTTRFKTSPLNRQRNDEIWRYIWRLNVPNSVKMHILKACRDAIPTCSNLYKRKVIEEDRCPICKAYLEAAGNALWSCVAARDVWSMVR